MALAREHAEALVLHETRRREAQEENVRLSLEEAAEKHAALVKEARGARNSADASGHFRDDTMPILSASEAEQAETSAAMLLHVRTCVSFVLFDGANGAPGQQK